MENPYKNTPIKGEGFERQANQPVSSETVERKDDRPHEANTIDIVRHGETVYKELVGKDFVFDPSQTGFKLTEEYLDLTDEGIENVKQAAEQLANSIDKENEVVLIVTSPNFRAQSTALIIADALRKEGDISFLTENGEPQTTRALRQMELQDPEDMTEWIDKAVAYREESQEHAYQTPDKAHEATAKRMGMELSELMKEDYDGIELRFNRFVRHFSNLRSYLKNPDTRNQIENKRLRIISVTHEEVPTKFMQETLGAETNLQKAQILELRPSGEILEDGKSMEMDIELLPKPSDENTQPQEVIVKRTFNPNR